LLYLTEKLNWKDHHTLLQAHTLITQAFFTSQTIQLTRKEFCVNEAEQTTALASAVNLVKWQMPQRCQQSMHYTYGSKSCNCRFLSCIQLH